MGLGDRVEAIGVRAQVYGVRPKAVRKAVRWRMEGARYMRDYARLGTGAWVTVDPALTGQILREIEAIAPEVAAVFERRVIPIAEAAQAAWPVDTGFSASLLRVDVTPTGTELRVSVVDDAPYAAFIRDRKGAPPTWLVLLVRPAQAVQSAMVAEILAARGGV